MKKNELVEIIRTLVKEEVHNTLPQLLMEVLAEKMTESSASILENKVEKKQAVQTVVKKQIAPQPAKQYSSNPILNQVLNETVGGVPQEETTPASAIDVLNNLTPQQLNENKEVAGVANAVNKDYRALLKAVDAKAKSKRR
jgi:hypothetical protein